jgi:hypothetical protein
MSGEKMGAVLKKIYLVLWGECLLFCVIQLLLVPAILLPESWLADGSGSRARFGGALQWVVQHYPASFSLFNLVLIPLMVVAFIGQVGCGLRPSRSEAGLMMAVLSLLLPFQIGAFVIFVIS